MRPLRTSRYLTLDIELCCWDGPPPAGMTNEIFEIGIAEVDAESLTVTSSHSWLVKPVRSVLSDYCEALTGVSQKEVDAKGKPLAEVLNSVVKAYAPRHKTLMTWGNDHHAIDIDCTAAGIVNPFPLANVINIGQVVNLAAGLDRRIGLQEAMKMLGLEVTGKTHRAAADAIDTAVVSIELSRIQRHSLGLAPAVEPRLII